MSSRSLETRPLFANDEDHAVVDVVDGGTKMPPTSSHRGGSYATIALGVALVLSVAAIVVSLVSFGIADDAKQLSSRGTASRRTTTTPMDISSFAGKRVMFISGHPDDVVGSSGGFVRALADMSEQNVAAGNANAAVDMHVLVITNGNAGCGSNASATKAECAAMRAAEEKRCDAMLGIDPANVVVEEQFDDNHLWDDTYPARAVVEVIVRNVRRVQPDVVITFYPDPQWSAIPADGYSDMGYHPDHQKVGLLATTAIALSSISSLALYNSTYGEPWKVSQLWMWQFVEPTHCFLVSEGLMKTQLDAFLEHRTQYTNATEVTSWMRSFRQLIGTNCGYAGGGYAEGFQRYL